MKKFRELFQGFWGKTEKRTSRGAREVHQAQIVWTLFVLLAFAFMTLLQLSKQEPGFRTIQTVQNHEAVEVSKNRIKSLVSNTGSAQN